MWLSLAQVLRKYFASDCAKNPALSSSLSPRLVIQDLNRPGKIGCERPEKRRLEGSKNRATEETIPCESDFPHNCSVVETPPSQYIFLTQHSPTALLFLTYRQHDGPHHHTLSFYPHDAPASPHPRGPRPPGRILASNPHSQRSQHHPILAMDGQLAHRSR